jgi:hypothetical protein
VGGWVDERCKARHGCGWACGQVLRWERRSGSREGVGYTPPHTKTSNGREGTPRRPLKQLLTRLSSASLRRGGAHACRTTKPKPSVPTRRNREHGHPRTSDRTARVNLNLSAGTSLENTAPMAFCRVIGKYSTKKNWALRGFTAPVSGFRVSAAGAPFARACVWVGGVRVRVCAGCVCGGRKAIVPQNVRNSPSTGEARFATLQRPGSSDRATSQARAHGRAGMRAHRHKGHQHAQGAHRHTHRTP